MDELHQKYKRLKEIIRGYGSLAVAFSGGVDSTFLLKAAVDELGSERVAAITASSCFSPDREMKEASDFCKNAGISQIVAEMDILSVDGVAQNPPDRCYLCKKSIFTQIINLASEKGLAVVAEGSNMDDTGDYRPGMKAIAELAVKSPLKEAGLYKEEIRQLSRELGLPTWSKPSFACLASRFVYGETITEDKLSMVDRAEQLLLEMGFTQFRVRIHGELARIELLPEDIPVIMQPENRLKVYEKLKEYGFSYVSLDLKGYRTGSMNEVLHTQR